MVERSETHQRRVDVMRRVSAALILLLLLMLGGGAAAQSWPERGWTKADPASSGWSAQKLARAERQAADLKLTAVMIVQHGKVIRWNDKQIIPAAWVKESTAAHTASAEHGLGYGYLWWRASASDERGLLMGEDSYFALGYGGQMLAVVPSRDLIIVKLVDHIAYPVDARRAATAELLRSIMSAAAGPD